MTTNTPEAWEDEFDNFDFFECSAVHEGQLRDFIRTLLHTQKVELLREVMERGGTEFISRTEITRVASRHGITEDELNQKEV